MTKLTAPGEDPTRDVLVATAERLGPLLVLDIHTLLNIFPSNIPRDPVPTLTTREAEPVLTATAEPSLGTSKLLDRRLP
jgi:hypothetical protein